MSLRPELTVEVMQKRGAGRLPGLMGYRVMAIEQGLLVAELDIRPELLAPNGYLHAATIVAPPSLHTSTDGPRGYNPSPSNRECGH